MTARVPLSHLVTLATTAAARYADKPAFSVIFSDGSKASLRYRDVQRWSDRFAAYLQSGLGLKPGERVAVCLPNVLAFPVCLIGAVKAGASVVILNANGTEQQMVDDLRETGSVVLVTLDQRASEVRRICERTSVRSVIAASVFEFFPLFARWTRQASWRLSGKLEPLPSGVRAFHDVLREARKIPLALPEVPADEVAGFLVSSAPGRPSVALSHRSLAHDVAQVVGSLRGRFQPGAEVCLAILPLASSPMLVSSFLVPFWIGAHTVLVPSWKPRASLQTAFDSYAVTWISATPRLLAALMNEPWLSQERAVRVRTTILSGDPAPASLCQRWKRHSGHDVMRCIMAGDTGGLLGFSADAEAPLLPVPELSLAVLGAEGLRLSAGGVGRLLVADARRRDAEAPWRATGDMVRLGVNGEFEPLGREEDPFEVEGRQVLPAEIEAALVSHPAVQDAAVIGVADSGGSVRFHACLVPVGEAKPSFDEIREHCLDLLPAGTFLESVELVSELPLSQDGNLMRGELRQCALERLKFRAMEEKMASLGKKRREKASVAATDGISP